MIALLVVVADTIKKRIVRSVKINYSVYIKEVGKWDFGVL